MAERVPGLRVLVADAYDGAADRLSPFLGLLGYDSPVALTGPQALELTRSYHPHVVLTELVLPGLDGFGLAQTVWEELPSTVLIAYTGLTASTHLARSRQAGFVFRLVKPAEPDHLLEMLAHAHYLSQQRQSDVSQQPQHLGDHVDF